MYKRQELQREAERQKELLFVQEERRIQIRELTAMSLEDLPSTAVGHQEQGKDPQDACASSQHIHSTANGHEQHGKKSGVVEDMADGQSSSQKSASHTATNQKEITDSEDSAASSETEHEEENAAEDLEEGHESEVSEGREDALSDVSSDCDLFDAQCYPGATWQTEQDEELECIEAIACHLRSHPLCPPHPEDPWQSWTDVDTGMKLPDMHCAFAGCSWTGTLCNSGDMLQAHICNSPPECPGAFVWPRVLKGQQHNRSMRMDYYVAAIEEKERQKMPDVGTSIDRRSFAFLQHYTGSHAIHSLICFICAQIKTDVQGSVHDAEKPSDSRAAVQPWYPSLDQRPSDISYVGGQYFQNLWQEENGPAKIRDNLGLQDFLNTFATASNGTSFPHCTELTDDSSWEWKRILHVNALPGGTMPVLCCPEDVQHCGAAHPKHEICSRCRVAVCAECMRHLKASDPAAYRIPMALANDNMWGYTSEIIARYKAVSYTHLTLPTNREV